MNRSSHNGFTLIEMLIYISLLSLIFIFIVSTILSFTSSYRQLLALRIVENSGIDSMERMTRDIRAAETVNTGQSVLTSNPGTLSITAMSGSTSTTTLFYLQGGRLQVSVNGTYDGPLTLSNSSTTNLVFTESTSSVSEAVKIDMTITATSGPVAATKSFHSTIILKGQ